MRIGAFFATIGVGLIAASVATMVLNGLWAEARRTQMDPVKTRWSCILFGTGVFVLAVANAIPPAS